MNTFNVTVLCKVDTRQLLFVADPTGLTSSICVYDEHTGQTLMRMTECSIECLERAIAVLREGLHNG